MYIGKVEVSNSWQKVEDLIKTQISGQSSFAFDADKTYTFQSEGAFGLRFCSVASSPATEQEGFRLSGYRMASYQKETGADLYVRTNGGNLSSTGILHIAQEG